jgi:hypothetical protein
MARQGVLGAAGVPATFIAPAAWKRTVGLFLASKNAARSEASGAGQTMQSDSPEFATTVVRRPLSSLLPVCAEPGP